VAVLVEKARTSKLLHPTPDVDNYAKGVLDAITASGIFWVDDKQIVDLRIVKQWTDEGASPGYRVTLSPASLPSIAQWIKTLIARI